jgi:hypothetical protein
VPVLRRALHAWGAGSMPVAAFECYDRFSTRFLSPLVWPSKFLKMTNAEWAESRPSLAWRARPWPRTSASPSRARGLWSTLWPRLFQPPVAFEPLPFAHGLARHLGAPHLRVAAQGGDLRAGRHGRPFFIRRGRSTDADDLRTQIWCRCGLCIRELPRDSSVSRGQSRPEHADPRGLPCGRRKNGRLANMALASVPRVANLSAAERRRPHPTCATAALGRLRGVESPTSTVRRAGGAQALIRPFSTGLLTRALSRGW